MRTDRNVLSGRCAVQQYAGRINLSKCFGVLGHGALGLVFVAVRERGLNLKGDGHFRVGIGGEGGNGFIGDLDQSQFSSRCVHRDGSVTTSSAIAVGGLALMVLPTLIVGNEMLIMGGVALAVGLWFLAHRHG